jgi:6-pyruvoyltetrahydropterin/6-carboxytetrahydropterin synthase
MHKLARQVRFSINPFGPQEKAGHNSFASNPPGEGLAVFFALWVELAGEIEADTGFVINVIEIDKAVREYAVPLFGECIRTRFANRKSLSFADFGELLKKVWRALNGKFGQGGISSLRLELNPFRKIGIDSEDSKEMTINEKFEFVATHTLWNEKFSKEKNFAVFGKCANPTGHGHNYVVEVSLKVPADDKWMGMGTFEKIVDENFISLVDHKNLNADIPQFGKTIPTVENIAIFAWEKLAPKFGEALNCINVWETDKTYCSYCGTREKR